MDTHVSGKAVKKTKGIINAKFRIMVTLNVENVERVEYRDPQGLQR